jgi:hypothetical protein
MVQEDLRSRVLPELRREWVERSLRLVTEHAPCGAGDVRTWPVWDLLRPHVVTVLGFAEAAGCPERATQLMSQLALLLHAVEARLIS